MEKEFTAFQEALEQHGVEVCIPEKVGKFVYDQLTPRDIGITIEDRFVLCNMTKASRRYEAAGIFKFLAEMEGKEPNILIPPDNDILLEGGDIIVDKNCIFVGISDRTNKKGFDYLQTIFGKDWKLIPVQCHKESNNTGPGVLHLDCTFNPVGEDLALIFKKGIKEIPQEIKDNYQWIDINHTEQKQLATNVISLSQNTVISRKHPVCKRVNDEMRNHGLKVIELEFNGAPKTGGSFRCCTLPLRRKK